MQEAGETSVNKWNSSLQTNALREWAKRAENAAGYTHALTHTHTHTHTQNKWFPNAQLPEDISQTSFKQDMVTAAQVAVIYIFTNLLGTYHSSKMTTWKRLLQLQGQGSLENIIWGLKVKLP